MVVVVIFVTTHDFDIVTERCAVWLDMVKCCGRSAHLLTSFMMYKKY
jgi:hypothetical protein